MTANYYFDDEGRFVIDQYQQAKPFSSFLPGIAGIHGIPMWAYYVNRGQGIASFGVEDKNGAIMEFFPADRSYSLVPLHGFRTFVKHRPALLDSDPAQASVASASSLDGNSTSSAPREWGYRELFSTMNAPDQEQQRMRISRNRLDLDSEDADTGLQVQVRYYTLPGESYAALVRQVELRNASDAAMELEVLDGMPAVLPFGIENAAYKELGYTLKSWMDVEGLDSQVPFYKLRGSTADTSEVHRIEAGHFMYSFMEQDGEEQLLQPLIDSGLIFGSNTALTVPEGFLRTSVSELMSQPQTTTNKVPCAFSGYAVELAAGAAVRHCMVIGHVQSVDDITGRLNELATMDYIQRKEREAEQLAHTLTDDMETRSAVPLFDEYCRQSYLDNLLRGGYPLLLDNGTKKPYVYHVYSRKHGDLERDYNFFKLQARTYSQGNGNFRDANQNRRNDVWFHPEIEDFNIRMFMSFIQPDGYNPLVVKGCSFRIRTVDEELLQLVGSDAHESFHTLLSGSYTPGELIDWSERFKHMLTVQPSELVTTVLGCSEQSFEADFGEGYWTDHWTYNLDLIESYLGVYPDRLETLLLTREYRYYDSPAWVQPREHKYVQLDDGRIRQYGAVLESKEKEAQLHNRERDANWVRTQQGKGEIYLSNLLEKLFSLVIIKLATLDPEGLGIEMEAGKPGWNDSMNGLPGLMASGFGELCELQRMIQFLLNAIQQLPQEGAIRLPVEVVQLVDRVEYALGVYEQSQTRQERDYTFWSTISEAREAYRLAIRWGFAGAEEALELTRIQLMLTKAERKLHEGMKRALDIGQGLYPTYFYYEAAQYELRTDESGRNQIEIKAFKRHDLPHFLEGPVRALKVKQSPISPQELHRNIRNSGLYDDALGMYKVNESLDGQPFELGRSRAFTPGWLENESIFMHMEFKYLLECLRNGLYEEFFADMQRALPPFMDAAVYGRSTLENSSFIASSANPDESLHGTGFIARLSGSTAEFLHMWLYMMMGEKPFRYDDDRLTFQLAPKLPGWLFDSEGTLSFRLLGSCEVTYIRANRQNTFSQNTLAASYELFYNDGSSKAIQGAVLEEQEAYDVRERRIARMKVYL
ncbi:hypothetical protein D3C74_81270 [compost metagenome]